MDVLEEIGRQAERHVDAGDVARFQHAALNTVESADRLTSGSVQLDDAERRRTGQVVAEHGTRVVTQSQPVRVVDLGLQLPTRKVKRNQLLTMCVCKYLSNVNTSKKVLSHSE